MPEGWESFYLLVGGAAGALLALDPVELLFELPHAATASAKPTSKAANTPTFRACEDTDLLLLFPCAGAHILTASFAILSTIFWTIPGIREAYGLG